MPNYIELNRTSLFWILSVSLAIIASAYLLGFTSGNLKGKSVLTPYEVDDSTKGKWLLVPDGWDAISIPDGSTYRKPWKKPTDQ